METGHATDDCWIIGEPAVAVDLAEVGEDALDVIEEVRPLRVPRQFSLLPGVEVSVNLLA